MNNILNGQTAEKTRYCWKCGKAVKKGTESCPGCGSLYDGVNRFGSLNPIGLGGIGWSDAFGDESLKKRKRFGSAYVAVFMLVTIAVIFIVMLSSGDISFDGESMKIFGLIAGGLVIFWLISMFVGRIGKSGGDWEGTVESKDERQRGDNMEFILNVRLDSGKKKKAVIKNDNMFFDYLNVGDKARYHGHGTDYYEKFDKSRDYVIPCIMCRNMRDVRENYCALCGTMLPKGKAAAPKPQPVVIRPQEAVCSSCGWKLKPGAKFCENCGKKIGG